MSLCFPNHLASESYLTLNAQIDLWLSNRLVNVSHLNFPRRIFSYVFYPAKMSSLGFYFNSLICTNMAGRFGAKNVPNGCVTSTSYLRSHQEKTHTSQHLGWDTKCQKCRHACGPFPPEKNGKKQQISTHASRISAKLGHANAMRDDVCVLICCFYHFFWRELSTRSNIFWFLPRVFPVSRPDTISPSCIIPCTRVPPAALQKNPTTHKRPSLIRPLRAESMGFQYIT